MAVYAKNYYSTIEQYSSLASIAFNEAPTAKLSAVGINSSSIDTSTFDSFRQGVEITLDKYAGLGVFKISAGTPGHIIQPVCLGVNANVDIVDQNFYTELDSLNPVAYLNLSDLSAKNRVYGTEQDFLERRDAYNGIIEPLSIRSVEGFMSNELPFQLHAIRAEFLEGNSGASNFSSEQILTVDYVPKTFISRAYKSKSWFFDGRNASNVDPGTGSLSGNVVITQQSNGCVKYFLTDLTQINTTLSVVEPFNDSKVYLQSMGLTTTTCGSDMMAVFNVMTGSTSNYVPPDKKSATTGFVYDNIGYAGTDSIAFGGMTY